MNVESYFDYNGSTPVDSRVMAESVRWMVEGFGNSAAAHPEGRAARAAIDRARERIARGIGADADEIWFTSGGTESNNWALDGVASAHTRGQVVVSAIEHKSVLATAAHLATRGFVVRHVAVGRDGVVDFEAFERALDSDTRVVSIMLANNETGVCQPVVSIARACRARSIPFHCDLVCALGKLPLDVREIGCDLASLSSHKLYAPKGCGVLYVRRGTPIAPLIHGCGQQSGLRSGSENTSGASAFGLAVELMSQGALNSETPLDELRDELWHALQSRFPFARRNGAGRILPNTLSVAFIGQSAERLQSALGARGFSVAAGAAASNGAPSHVLEAMGLSHEARSTLRFSLGRFTRRASLAALVEALEASMPSCTLTETAR